MANEPLPLKRNRYAYPPSQECRITGSNLNRDFDDYHLPHSRLALASLQDWGVAQGLEVTGIIGNTEIAINSGAALDGQGQLIWLAGNGSGTLDINPPTKVPVPVKLNTSNYQRAEDTTYYLTITFFEWEQREVGRPCDRVLEQVPWIRLQPISGDGAYVDDGTSVVLGQVVIDAQGKLKELKADGCRLVGKTVEQLTFRRADKAADQVKQVSAAKIKPATSGGLQITVPEATDQVLLQKEDGGNFAQLAVQANTLDVTGNVKASGVLQGNSLQLSAGATMNGSLTIQNALTVSSNVDIGGNLKVSGNLEVQGNVIARDTEHIAGNVGIGTINPAAGLEINKGATNDIALLLNSSGLGWGSGLILKNTASGGKSYGIYSGWGTLHFADVDNSVDRMAITKDGNIGIGTTNPEAKLTVIGTATISDGNHYATKGGFMATGSLTIGSIEKSYGGSDQCWNPNTAGLLLETSANTEIAVHDAYTRVASLMYYEGDTKNRITIGRDMGWGAINTVSINGNMEVTKTLTAQKFVGDGAVGTGMIVMWSGLETNIPSGWALCDGQKGTPDLRDKFLIGAGGKYRVGSTGGAEKIALTEQQMPKHSHLYDRVPKGRMKWKSGDEDPYWAGAFDPQWESVGSEEKGRSEPHENMPPYYALCFIMKL